MNQLKIILKEKNIFLILIFTGFIFLIVLILRLVLIDFKIFNFVNAQEEKLICEIRNFECDGLKPVEVFRMSKPSNAHAGTPTGSNYIYRVCCGGVTGLGNDCNAENKEVVLRLSGSTNAHVRQNNYGDYPGGHKVCLSLDDPSKKISIVYRSLTSCTTDETIIASISSPTNAHVGGGNAYSIKICAKITESPVISVSVSDGNVEYGIMPPDTSKSTLDLNDMQTVTNDGNVKENFNIKGKNSECWTLDSINGPDQYVHQFCNTKNYDCNNPPLNYSPLTTDYQQFASNIPPEGNVGLHLLLTTPTESSCYNQQSVDVTIQAVQAP